jgi:hypothetical protein
MRIILAIMQGSWALFAIFLALMFTVPKLMVKIIGPVSIAMLFLWVVIGTGVYKILCLYETGMKRP